MVNISRLTDDEFSTDQLKCLVDAWRIWLNRWEQEKGRGSNLPHKEDLDFILPLVKNVEEKHDQEAALVLLGIIKECGASFEVPFDEQVKEAGVVNKGKVLKAVIKYQNNLGDKDFNPLQVYSERFTEPWWDKDDEQW